MAINGVTISESDVDEIRGVLQASLVYFQAEDLQRAQINFTSNNPSQLTSELQRVLTRIDYYWGDYLIEKREAELDFEDADEETETEEEFDDEETEEAEAEEDAPLAENPLGSVKVERQKGRRLAPDEV